MRSHQVALGLLLMGFAAGLLLCSLIIIGGC